MALKFLNNGTFSGYIQLQNTKNLQFIGSAGDHARIFYTQGDGTTGDVWSHGFYQNSGLQASIEFYAATEALANGNIKFKTGATANTLVLDADQNASFAGTVTAPNLNLTSLSNNVASSSVLVINEITSGELVTNGDFDTNSDWTNDAGTNWTISGGKASVSNTGNIRYFQQSGVLGNPSVNKKYLITWTISGLTQGAIGVNVGGYITTTMQTLNGTYQEEITPTNASSNTILYLQSSANTIGSVDNVSAKEITSATNEVQKRNLKNGAFGDELWAVTPTDSDNIYNLNSGNVAIGNTSPQAPLHVTTNTDLSNALILEFAGTSQGGPWQTFQYDEGAAAPSEAGDLIGGIRARTAYTSGGSYAGYGTAIEFRNDGGISSTTSPGRIEFYTTSSASVTPALRLTIDSSGNSTFTGNIIAGDDKKIRLGNSSDLEIYHDGDDSYIDAGGQGDLRIDTSKLRIRNAAGTETMIIASENGSVELYHNDVKKLQTFSTGVTITGKATISGDIILDQTGPRIDFDNGSAGSLRLFSVSESAAAVTITSAGNLTAEGQAFSTATSSGDASSTLTTKGYVDGLITGATIYRGAWQAGISATSSAATTASATLTVTAAILDADGNTPVLVGAVVTGAGITGIVKVASVTSSTVYVLDTAIDATATAYIFSPIYGAPDLSSVTETSGYYYICSEAGSATPNGANSEPNTWNVGDWCIYNDVSGTGQWQKIDNSSVLSGAGTGQTVALWEGPSSVADSETLGNAPITVSGNNATFAGNVGIKTTATNAILTVTGAVDDDWAGRFENTSSDGFGVLAKINSTSSGDYIFQARTGSTNVMTILGDGNSTFAGIVTVSSDTGLKIYTTTALVGANINFSDETTGNLQNGTITYKHQDTASYGSANSFLISGTESTMTILADGKLMYKEGVYLKPATGTGGGTRKDLNWNTAYNDSITGLAVTGTTTKTLTATQQDGGTLTASWTDNDGGGTVKGTGTATRVAFWSATDTISSSADLYWDNTNNRLGVGLTSPSAPLHVVTSTDLSDALILEFAGTYQGGPYQTFQYNEGGAAPSEDGDLIGGIRARAAYAAGTYAGYSTAIEFRNDAAISSTSAPGRIEFYTTSAASVTPVERLRITSGGDVQIGNVTGAKLSISGSVGTTNGTAALPTHTFYSDLNTGMFRAAVDTLAFSTGGTERVRIASTGETTITNTSGNTLTLKKPTGAALNWNDSTQIRAGIHGINGADGMQFLTGSSQTKRMTIQSDGNIGIGTEDPNQKLEVVGSIKIANSNSRLVFGAENGTDRRALEGNTSGSLLQIGESYTDIALQGNVGIGVTAPGALLQVGDAPTSSSQQGARIYGYDGALSLYTTRSESNFNTALYLYNDPTGSAVGTGTGIHFRANSDTTFGQLQASAYSSWTTNTHASRTAKLVFQTCNSGIVSDKMTILGNGNVGIGYTAPNAKLHVLGSVILDGNSVSDPDATSRNAYPGDQMFTHYSNNGVSIIGGQGGYTGCGLTIGEETGRSTSFNFIRGVSDTNGGAAAAIEFSINGVGTATFAGDVVAFGSPSDKRLKENIKPIESALDKVSKLQGVTFDWKKSDSELKIKEDIGFIAQDVQKVIPELVRENEDGMLSMRHQGIAPILLEAIKELKAEIEELKNKPCNCNNCNCNK